MNSLDIIRLHLFFSQTWHTSLFYKCKRGHGSLIKRFSITVWSCRGSEMLASHLHGNISLKNLKNWFSKTTFTAYVLFFPLMIFWFWIYFTLQNWSVSFTLFVFCSLNAKGSILFLGQCLSEACLSIRALQWLWTNVEGFERLGGLFISHCPSSALWPESFQSCQPTYAESIPGKSLLFLKNWIYYVFQF